MAVKTQLNAAHAQLNKKLRMDDFLTISTFSEKRVFLNNHYTEFHKFGREIFQTAVKWKIVFFF